MARVELALPLAGLLLAACAPARAPMTPEQLDDYAAGLKRAPASTPTPEPTRIPALPTKEAFNPQDPRVREIYQPPVPGVFGGGAPPDLLPPTFTPVPPSATPRATETITETLKRIRPEPTLPPEPPKELPPNAPAELKSLYQELENIVQYAGNLGGSIVGRNKEQVLRRFRILLYRSTQPPYNTPGPIVPTPLEDYWNGWASEVLGAQTPGPLFEHAKKLRRYLQEKYPLSFKQSEWVIGDGRRYQFD